MFESWLWKTSPFLKEIEAKNENRWRAEEVHNLITIFKMVDLGTKRLMDLLDSNLEVSGFLQVKPKAAIQDYPLWMISRHPKSFTLSAYELN